jgi:DNA-binding PadR family transcriptional regulator
MGRRFFGHGELPLVLLALLAERPMHGYDLMAELGRLFAPHYRPSPGSVYPAVEALDAEGLITPRDDGAPRVYRPTLLGEQALEERRDALAAVELRTGMRVGQRRTVNSALERFASRVRVLAGRLDPDALEQLLDQAVGAIEASAVTDQAASEKERA